MPGNLVSIFSQKSFDHTGYIGDGEVVANLSKKILYIHIVRKRYIFPFFYRIRRSAGKVTYIRLLCFIVLLTLPTSVEVFAEIYDNAGEIITKEEIEREMRLMHEMGEHPGRVYMIGGCTGCVVGSLCFLIALVNSVLGEDQSNDVLGTAGIAITIVTPSLGYLIGYSRDRQVAIEKIKAKRNSQRQGFLDSGNIHYFTAKMGADELFGQFPYHRDRIDIRLLLLAGRF